MVFENERSLVLYINESAKFKRLTEEEQLSYIINYQRFKDDNSREQIVKNNMLFVLNYARKYIKTNLEITDLISEGLIGLIGAIDKYDVNYNMKFLTYAGWHIKKRMMDFINSNMSIVSVPYNIIQAHNHVLKEYEKNFAQKGYDDLSLDDINDRIKGYSKNTLDNAIDYISNIKYRNTTRVSQNAYNTSAVLNRQDYFIDNLESDTIDTENNNSLNINDITSCLSIEESEFILSYFKINDIIFEDRYKYSDNKKKNLVLKIIDKIKLRNGIDLNHIKDNNLSLF